MNSGSLNNIAIVLVEPQGPLNVGGVARAMKNMGLRDLVVVGDLDPLSEESRLFAAHSEDILESARRFESLGEALSDRAFVIGTTARDRHRIPTASPHEAAPKILDRAQTVPTAILFGREDHGLFKEELDLCHMVLAAATSTERTSLNLAQAVLLVAYELFQASEAPNKRASTAEGDLIAGDVWQRLYDEVVGACRDTGYLHDGNARSIEDGMRRFLRIGPIQTRDARHVFGLMRRMTKILDGEATANRKPKGSA